MYNQITDNELQLMRYFISEYGASYSDTVINPIEDMEYLLRHWKAYKGDLYKLLDNNLIITKPICVNKPAKFLEEQFWEKLHKVGSEGHTFYYAFNNFVYDYVYTNIYRPTHTLNPTTNINLLDLSAHLTALVSAAALTYNEYQYDYTIELIHPNHHKPLKIKRGCKTMKALGKIAKMFNLPGFEEFRIAHSMILNQKTFNGDLCFSIHPLDYITMSDNNCNWDSCMSWMHKGDYRQGTVEMMNSPCVIVAYLKAEDDMEFNNGLAWNNKRWRQLFIVNEDIILAIKGYPFQDIGLTEICLNELKARAEKNLGWNSYTKDFVTIQNFTSNTIEGFDEKVDVEITADCMYNDIYDFHTCYLSTEIHRIRLNYSGPSQCMQCGKTITEMLDDIDTQDLICLSCNDYMRCPECGDLTLKSDMTTVDGMEYCDYCYDRVTSECNMCGDIHLSCNNTTVLLIVNNEEKSFTKICDECYDKIREWLANGYGTRSNGWWSYDTTINLEEVAPNHLEDIQDIFEIPDNLWKEYIAVISVKTKDNPTVRLLDWAKDELAGYVTLS